MKNSNRNLTVHKHTAATVKTILNEFGACGEVLQQVFIVDIVNFDYLVRKAFEQLWVQWQFENG